jgi:hypothetical protein
MCTRVTELVDGGRRYITVDGKLPQKKHTHTSALELLYKKKTNGILFLLVIFMFLFEKKRFLSVKFHNNNKSNAMQHLHIMYIDFYRSACTSSSNQTADIYFLVKKKQNKK